MRAFRLTAARIPVYTQGMRKRKKPTKTSLWLALTGGILLTSMMAAQTVGGAANKAGERVYQRSCASCHGPKGEGTKAYRRALVGHATVKELSEYIGRSMPPGPKRLPPAEASAVAAYIYDAFYSPIAQERNRPPRVALSRLTVRQFRQSVTDLVGSFRPEPRLDERRGLAAEYFRARRMSQNERVIERLDPEIRFDWGTAAPAKDGFDPYQFSARWRGSLVAPDTGEYEIVIRSNHSVRMWLNNRRTPLIDRWVQSGNETEHRASIYLLAGQAYPLLVEFSKSTQGVDDTDKQQGRKVPPAFMTLAWRRPRLAEEPIPQRCLTPSETPEVYVVSTPFPPDDRSQGYERGASVSKAWDQAVTSAAMDAAGYVAENLRDLAGVDRNAQDRVSRLKAFSRQFVERAFRRPLTADEARVYVDRHFETAPDADMAVKRIVLLTLKSPRFLYPELAGNPADGYTVASRLALGLWDSLPDKELLRAAAAGELTSREQVIRQAERMAGDARAWQKLQSFFYHWLKVDQVTELAKDTKRFPGFDAAAATDLRTSFDLMLESTLKSGDYRQLMNTDRYMLNGRLARLYGGELPEDAPFQPVALDGGTRRGILAHPYLLSVLAYLDSSSPIHRGVLLARNVLGRMLQPPPEAVAPIAADLHPSLTTRQRVELQTKPAACMSCHSLINPLGFALERYDAIGKRREKDNGKPVDDSGYYRTRDGRLVKFSSPADLSSFIATSGEAHAAFVEKLFLYMVKQPVRAYGPGLAQTLQSRFAASQYNVKSIAALSVAETAMGSPVKSAGQTGKGNRTDA